MSVRSDADRARGRDWLTSARTLADDARTLLDRLRRPVTPHVKR